MLRMGMTIRNLGCITFLAAMTVSSALSAIAKETNGENIIDIDDDLDAPANNDHREKRFAAYSSSGLRVGEKTPVYIAEGFGPKEPVDYTLVDRWIVRDAIAEWRARPTVGWDNINYGWPSANQPDVEEFNAEESIEWNAMSNVSNSLENYQLSRSKRAQDSSEDDRVYIPILVVMDFPSSWRNNERDKCIKDQVRYAIAFWNAIAWRYRKKTNPKLEILITGIIIGRNKAAAPYLRKREGEHGLNTYQAWYALDLYFKKETTLGHQSREDSPLRFNPTISVITDSKPAKWLKENPLRDNQILFCDDHVFGALAKFNHTKWVTHNLKKLTRAWIANNPKAVSNFIGKRIEGLPMPGQLIPPNKQCEFYGYSPDNKVCYYWDPCPALHCKVGFAAPCRTYGPPIDGTFCSEGKVCLGGKCLHDIKMAY